MDHDQQPGSIASHVAKTLESFRSLERALSITAGSNYVLEGATLSDFPLQIENNFIRFKMWVGDQAAHQSGPSSLDYRLREADHLRKQVIYLLTDISESLQAATSLAHHSLPSPEQKQEDGKNEILEDDDSQSSFPESGEDDESNFSGSDSDSLSSSGLSTLLTDIGEVVDCLLRLSAAIANPAPHERFRKFGAGPSEDVSFYEPRDVTYVRDNFPRISGDSIACALGKFITRRRQFFKYRHHERLASSEESMISDKETEICHTELVSETVTSAFPKRPKTVANFDTNVFVNNQHIQADAGMSQMSYVAPTRNWRLPPRPTAAEHEIFECPFCCRMISAKTDAAWEQHILGDLRPYTCIFYKCIESNLDFDRRESWQSHLLKYHWLSWACPFKCQEHIPSAAELRHHIREHHFPTGTEEELKSIAALGERDASHDTLRHCPLCLQCYNGLAGYVEHVGCHLEQLALFALPSLETRARDPSHFAWDPEELDSSNRSSLSVQQRLQSQSGKKQ
ncbi:uncharacterized protein B0J16DRAFT_369918 [Fusarium flagelliforme]|uniref:uncharacterized protein n=1 Tax=Fusarium flagelliforme TaxID=2675880 RepID=UPI001E8CCC04|nr:uncharacterized protein B0J16DRAFT_369918 [Fusarium flagelliforme]KAH7193853.1 hypothetical protein B0J16DRAFT_369918 [Fusarium flagelliforme]